MAKKKGNGKARTSAEAFVKAWAKGGTRYDVADRLGVTVGSVSSRGKRLAALGVALPELERRSPVYAVDVDGLNAILRAAK